MPPYARHAPVCRPASGGGATASELSPVVVGGTLASGSAPPVTVVQASPEVQCCICRGHLARSEALPVKGNYICLGCGMEVLEQLRRCGTEVLEQLELLRRCGTELLEQLRRFQNA